MNEPFPDDQPPVGALDADADANVSAAIASTPADHPDFARLTSPAHPVTPSATPRTDAVMMTRDPSNWADDDPEMVVPLKHARTLEEELAARSWQPIETAPRDGSHVILTDSKRQWLGYWEAQSPYGGTTNEFVSCTLPWASGEKKPTHWMPLPPSPNQ